MKLFIGLIIAFLLFLYIYTFLKIRKKRKKNANTVTRNLQFVRKNHFKNKEKDSIHDKNLNYENYITKYNSQIDYIEKDQLLSDENK